MDSDKLAKRNKIILASGISFASISMLGSIISASITPEAPDPKELTPRAKVVYMASEEFSRLPEQKKVEYMRKAGRSRGAYRQLNSEERQAVSKNTRKVWEQQMKERMNKFFQMTEEEQNAYLDQRIAQRKQWRAAREARRNQNGSANRRSNNNNNNNSNNRNSANRSARRSARRQGRLENTDSTTRAQMSEFFRRMREREKQTQGK